MDEPLRKLTVFVQCVCIALATTTHFVGCSWLKNRSQAKNVRPSISDLENEADSPAKTELASQSKATAPVALDGSAADNGAPETPNAPGIALKAPPSANISQSAISQATSDEALSEKQSKSAIRSLGAKSTKVVPANSTSGGGANQGTTVEKADFNVAEGGNSKPPISDAKTDAAAASLPGTFEVAGDGVKVDEGIVVCTVNGAPIFLDDVLRDIPRANIANAEKALSPEQFQQYMAANLEPRLNAAIDEELLIQGLKNKLKPEQFKDIIKQIDQHFDKEDALVAAKQHGCNTVAEYADLLRRNGTSIEAIKNFSRRRQLAEQYFGYMSHKVLPKETYERPDLLDYYSEHKEDYKIIGMVNWQQISLSYRKHGGPEKSRELAKSIRQRLKDGEDFGELAKEFSDGPTAKSKGGMRGWTKHDTMADEKLNKALAELPIGVVSRSIEGETGIEIVLVIDRTEDQYKPFSAVQEDIKMQLKSADMQKSRTKVVEDLRKDANIVRPSED